MKFFSGQLALIWILIMHFQNYILAQGPDSGRNLLFSNATTNRVNIPDAPAFDHPSNNLTMEAWVNPSSYAASGEMIFSKIETNNTREFYIYIEAGGLLRFVIIDNADVAYILLSTTTIPLNTWTHIAATYSFASGMEKIYLNGILNASNNIGSVTIASTSIQPLIGAYWLTNNNVSRGHFEGSIDEVRLWYVERTQTEIRDNMCQTLVPPLVNLVAYYRLDETNGILAADMSGNGNNGTLENFLAGQVVARNYSGAPIGNQSIYTYSNTFPLVLNSPSVGKLTINNVTGVPAVFHLFRVDATPSQTGGLSSPANTYFGTFVAGGAAPTYTAVYDYSGTVYDNSLCENNFVLKQRDDNSIATWTLLPNVLNTTANTLTAANISGRKEIILDCDIPAPVDFISFNLKINNKTTLLNWSTAHEQNNLYFIIEKSTDLNHFNTIGRVDALLLQTTINNYVYIDNEWSMGTVYYKLKQVDINGAYKYSEIKSINSSSAPEFEIFPNPNNGSFQMETVHIGSWNFKILNDKGQEVYEYINDSETIGAINVELAHLLPGFYTVLFYYESGMIIKKLIIQ
jgi:hypothetical protein